MLIPEPGPLLPPSKDTLRNARPYRLYLLHHNEVLHPSHDPVRFYVLSVTTHLFDSGFSLGLAGLGGRATNIPAVASLSFPLPIPSPYGAIGGPGAPEPPFTQGAAGGRSSYSRSFLRIYRRRKKHAAIQPIIITRARTTIIITHCQWVDILENPHQLPVQNNL